MLLVVDIGNSNITLGVFEKNILKNIFRLPSDKNFSKKEYLELLKNLNINYQIESCAIASVVSELDLTIKYVLDKFFNINSLLIDKSSELDLKIDLPNPNEVGIDRIANACYSKNNYHLPAIIVDIGSAITFDIVSKEGAFLGGVIMPGLNMQLKSLNLNTSKLPEIEIGLSKKAIGDSTKSAILSGIMRGTACAIEGLISQCELELGEKATIIATGGQSELISDYISRKFDYLDKTLTLKGIKQIFEQN